MRLGKLCPRLMRNQFIPTMKSAIVPMIKLSLRKKICFVVIIPYSGNNPFLIWPFPFLLSTIISVLRGQDFRKLMPKREDRVIDSQTGYTYITFISCNVYRFQLLWDTCKYYVDHKIKSNCRISPCKCI